MSIRRMAKYLQSGTTLGDIANYLETSGESGADLGSGIERILVQDCWVRMGTDGRPIAVYPNRRTVAAKRLGQVLRRMYWPGNEWDADLGPDLERILGAERDDASGDDPQWRILRGGESLGIFEAKDKRGALDLAEKAGKIRPGEWHGLRVVPR